MAWQENYKKRGKTNRHVRHPVFTLGDHLLLRVVSAVFSVIAFSDVDGTGHA